MPEQVEPTGTRVLVCGGRAYHDLTTVFEVLDTLDKEYKFSVLISGCASGADLCGLLWANKNKVEVLTFPAKWKQYGDAAGPIRNQLMLDEGKPDLVVAFPGDKGTRDMTTRAKLAGVKVLKQ